MDVSTSGSRFYALGSPSLAHLIKQTALDVPHPTEANHTLWDATDGEGPFKELLQNGTADIEYLELYHRKEIKQRASKTKIGPLGSGSDFTVFLQRLGVASSDQSFGTTLSDAPYHYHSIYDSQSWQERYADPGFHRHVGAPFKFTNLSLNISLKVAVAQYLGLLGLRLVDSIVVPLNTTQYSLELDDYLDEWVIIILVMQLADYVFNQCGEPGSFLRGLGEECSIFFSPQSHSRRSGCELQT